MSVQGFSDEKKIFTLQRMGFNSAQIGEITGIPEPTVRKKWARKSKKP
jgi:DNA-directed RNA polymerase specialized sigma24 family protein